MSIPPPPPHYPRSGIGDHLKSVEIVAEPIEAWRAWGIHSQTKLLWSWGIKSNYWVKGVNHAECKSPGYPLTLARHSAPSMDCRCGFWAFKNPGNLSLAISSEIHLTTYAWGKIKLWGKIIEGSAGYRGEYAKIEEVILVNAKDKNLLHDRIESSYEVLVTFGHHPSRPLTPGEVFENQMAALKRIRTRRMI